MCGEQLATAIAEAKALADDVQKQLEDRQGYEVSTKNSGNSGH
jgi:hypothetical protein